MLKWLWLTDYHFTLHFVNVRSGGKVLGAFIQKGSSNIIF